MNSKIRPMSDIDPYADKFRPARLHTFLKWRTVVQRFTEVQTFKFHSAPELELSM